jgi:SAM-dependent methyltransferase
MLPELYHAHHSRYTEDLPFWLGLADQMGAPVLELGCGTGRVLVPLAQAGYRIFGMDHDLAMLRFLMGRVKPAEPRPLLVASDLTRFNLALRFPLIILPCNTYSTLRENERLACLGCVHRHLKPDGRFAVSIPNPRRLENLPARSASEVEDEFLHPETGNPVQVSSAWRRTKDTFQVTWTYDQLYPDGKVDRHLTKTIHQLLSVDRYLDEMRAARLEVTDLYGDFDRSPYDGESPYLIVVTCP